MVNIDLRGTISNRYGVGATVRIESALGSQTRQLVLARGYMSSSEPMLHFGLGADTVVHKMVVTWPSGRAQSFENLAVDMRYMVTEPRGGTTQAAGAGNPPTLFQETAQGVGLALASRERAIDEIYLQPLSTPRCTSSRPEQRMLPTRASPEPRPWYPEKGSHA